MNCKRSFKKCNRCRNCILSLEKDILRISRKCFKDVYWSTIRRVIHECDLQHSIFAFSEDGLLQGFILVRNDLLIDHNAQLHIEFVAVDPQFAGKGIGNVMMSALIKAASQACNTSLQDYRLWLHVDEDNYSAQHLYKKYGFKYKESIPDDFGYIGYIMIT